MARVSIKTAAEKALTDFLGLSPDETLLVVTDEKMRTIGMALFEAGKELADEAIYAEMSPRNIDGEEPPETISDIMKQVDVVIAATSKSITHTDARREASKVGVRVATMPGLSTSSMARCMTADYKEIIEMTEKVHKTLQGAKVIHVTSVAGTDLKLPVKDRNIMKSTGVLRKIGESGNIPSGEVYVSPWEGKTNGTVVFDGSIAGIGLIKNPITVEIKEGAVTSITGKTEATKLQKLFDDAGEDSMLVAEFGMGTNYKAKVTGDILEDEKTLGTIHIAFGNNINMGGSIKAHSHFDCVVLNPTVHCDGKKIMDEGELLI
jgi:aminopeptidase